MWRVGKEGGGGEREEVRKKGDEASEEGRR